MNDIVNFSRFAKIVQSECFTFTVRRSYLGMIVVVAAYAVIAYIVSGFTSLAPDGLAGLVIAWIIIEPFVFYNDVYHRIKGVNYAMLPASNVEKWLAFWLQCVVIIPLIVGILWVIVAGLDSLFFHTDSLVSHLNKRDLWDNYRDTICVQSVVMMGVMSFRRLKWLKTLGVVLGVAVVMLLITSLLAHIFGVHGNSTFNFSFSTSDSGDLMMNGNEEGFKWLSRYGQIILYAIFPFGMWLASFFKLQEQNI